MNNIMELTTKRILPLLFLLSLTACDEDSGVPSDSYATNEIYPNITAVETQDGGVITTVVLEPDPNTGDMLYLNGGDRFYTSLGTPPDQLISFGDELFTNAQLLSTRLKIMEQNGTSEYSSIDTTAGLAPPVRAYVAFERGYGKWTGQTWVELPPAFTLLNPAPNSSISRTFDDPITLSWTDIDNTATMQLESQMVCLYTRYPIVTINLGIDTGTAQVSAADYFPPGAPINWDCRASFTLKRIGPTRFISSELGLGSLNTFQGIQQRTVEFTSAP